MLPDDKVSKLVAGSAPSVKVCWVVGNKGTIYRTTDGTIWRKIPAPAQADLTAVDAKDASSATVTLKDGKKFSTSNGGKTWRAVQ